MFVQFYIFGSMQSILENSIFFFNFTYTKKNSTECDLCVVLFKTFQEMIGLSN